MRIMITGITGTVGRAFAEYLYDSHVLYGVDRHEESITGFTNQFPRITVKTGDFADIDFAGMEIDLLIHLAAMKHVDLCEQNPNSCIINNVIKTHKLFANAHANEVDILFMSTDKAVEPISVYGYTKALGEKMALDFNGAFVRSGNVTDASGSVMQVWDKAIKFKQPLMITHKDMRRFFISPNNLVKRVWSGYLDGDQVIIPKMDKEVAIIDIAKQKLAQAGYTLENYPGGIEYIGLRPGEKLIEKLE